jgi:hypothetical protein
MGTFWHAHDLARGVPVQVHELQGGYAQWRPATLAGHELVVEGGRTFVILPIASPAPPVAVPVPAPARRSGRRWLIIGLVGCAVVVSTAVAIGFALAPVASSPTPPAAGASPSGRPAEPSRPVNASLMGIATGDCARLTTTAWTDPFEEINASIAPCERAADIHYVTTTQSMARDEVRDNLGSCATNLDGQQLAVWVSADGVAGTLVCFGAAEG